MDATDMEQLDPIGNTRIKRSARFLSPNEKLHAVHRIRSGETKASVSRDIGIPESTLRGWCKNEQKLLDLCNQASTAMEQPTNKRKKTNSRAKLAQNRNMDHNSTADATKNNKLNKNQESGHAYMQNQNGNLFSVPHAKGIASVNNFSALSMYGSNICVMPSTSASCSNTAETVVNATELNAAHMAQAFQNNVSKIGSDLQALQDPSKLSDMEQLSYLPYALAAIFNPTPESEGANQAYLVEWWKVFYSHLTYLATTTYTNPAEHDSHDNSFVAEQNSQEAINSNNYKTAVTQNMQHNESNKTNTKTEKELPISIPTTIDLADNN